MPTWTVLDTYDGDGTTEATTALSGTSPGSYDVIVVLGAGWGAGLTITSWDSDIAGTALTQLFAGQRAGGNQWSSCHVIYSDETGYPTGAFTADLDLSGNSQLRACLVGGSDIDMTLSAASRTRASGSDNSASGDPTVSVTSSTDDSVLAALGFYQNQPTAEAGELFHANNGSATSSAYFHYEDGEGATTTIEYGSATGNAYYLGAVSFVGTSGAFTMAGESGTFTLSGTDADLDLAVSMAGESGTFTLTGTDAVLTPSQNQTLDAESGTFTLAGTDADLNLSYYMEALMSVITMTAPDVNLSVGNVLVGESGTFALTGTDADLIADVIMPGETGSFVLTGTDASLFEDLSLTAESGSFALTGTDAGLSASYIMSGDSGSFVLTGSDATFIADLTLTAETGTFSLLGSDVVFTVPGLAVRAARHTQSPVIRRHTISPIH